MQFNDVDKKINRFKEGMQFMTATVSARYRNTRHQILSDTYALHIYSRPEGICTAIATDSEYKSMLAQHTLSVVSAEFLKLHPVSEFRSYQDGSRPKEQLSFPRLQYYLEEAQHPENNNISKIQTELDETKVILHRSIESVLERGEKIDDLVQRSGDLSTQSKLFFHSAKRTNSSCCIVM